MIGLIMTLFLFGLIAYYLYEVEKSQESLWDDVLLSSDDSEEEYERFHQEIYTV